MWELASENIGFSVMVVGLGAALVVVVLVGFRDIFLQRRHAIQHNFPVVGHLRYLMERIGPELRQYWVANDKEELPFNRSERSWIYASAKSENNTFGFGTSEQVYSAGYPIIKHSAFPFPDSEARTVDDDPTTVPCLKVMGLHHQRRRLWRPMSIINVSAMSYGSLGRNAILALNKGVASAGAYHNTGEGGVSPYHLEGGAELIWQLGTGYFGARNDDGTLSLDKLAERCASSPQIRAIEIKLSQGAKPGKGGILPGEKVTEEIAAIRGIPVGMSCHSPNAHTAFHTVDELIDLIEQIADRTGLPVGIKSAVGHLDFWHALADRMQARQEGPDFIQIDGGEGGTGAAPLTFSDHVSLPYKVGMGRVFPIFQQQGISGDIVWIGSGKLGFPDRAVVAIGMGADMIAVAREAMLSIGCIQAQKCHTGHCPAGVATHDRWLQAGLDVDDKSQRAARYLKTFRKELLSLAHAAGHEHPGQFTGDDVEFCTGINQFTPLTEVMGYRTDMIPFDGMATLTRYD
jgi:glutamate synthase (ferredoxin)